jgi:hypothetical protein
VNGATMRVREVTYSSSLSVPYPCDAHGGTACVQQRIAMQLIAAAQWEAYEDCRDIRSVCIT